MSVVIGIALYSMKGNGAGTNLIEPNLLAAQDKKLAGQDWNLRPSLTPTRRRS